MKSKAIRYKRFVTSIWRWRGEKSWDWSVNPAAAKSTVLMSIMGLLPSPGRIVAGSIRFEGLELTTLPTVKMRHLRGNDMSMIFQDPMTTLNPVFRVGEQIREVLRVHNIVRKNGPFQWAGRARKHQEIGMVLKLMQEVGIPSVKDRYREFPHEYSGGMQQRALIAAALACQPSLLLADEPTTALDVTIQAQIVALLERINREHGTAIILVTHDLALAAEFCNRIAVMYAGEIVEEGSTDDIIEHPRHPYTSGLLKSIPNICGAREKIEPIPGMVPDLADLPSGCAFSQRCNFRGPWCQHPVDLIKIGPGHRVRCARVERGEDKGDQS